jgi:hypothetical protein
MNHRLLPAALAALILLVPASASASTGCDPARLTELHFPGGCSPDAIKAFQKANDLSVDGIVGPATRAALADPAVLTPSDASRGIHAEVDLARQLLLVVRNGAISRVYSVSTGMAGYDTPTGTFKVFRKERRSWSVPYHVWLPYASYFTGGVAFHAGDTATSRASHGCVRVPSRFARDVYRVLKTGMKVIVREA